MPNIDSAKKRVKVIEKKTAANKAHHFATIYTDKKITGITTILDIVKRLGKLYTLNLFSKKIKLTTIVG